jgi:BirA family biotin operon repressor/biotin-[acetyl-CoA-carboxylase] ligase
VTNPVKEWRDPGRRVGRRVMVHDRVRSTNDLAADLGRDPANDGVVVVASEQTAGRGQHGRHWSARPGSSVLMSIALSPPEQLRRPALLTAWVAVAVCGTIQRTTGQPARIKWPNDVLIRGRKVCGILIEAGAAFVVVGIGLNVAQSREDFESEGLIEATSLQQYCATPLETEEVARNLIDELDRSYAELLEGEVSPLEGLWGWHLGLLGKQVEAECTDGSIRGRLTDVSFAGLRLQGPGRTQTCPPERVLHLRPL